MNYKSFITGLLLWTLYLTNVAFSIHTQTISSGQVTKRLSSVEEVLRRYCFLCYGHWREAQIGNQKNLDSLDSSIEKIKRISEGQNGYGERLEMDFKFAFEEYGISFYRFKATPGIWGDPQNRAYVKYIGIDTSGRLFKTRKLFHSEEGYTEVKSAPSLVKSILFYCDFFYLSESLKQKYAYLEIDTIRFSEAIRLYDLLTEKDTSRFIIQYDEKTFKSKKEYSSYNKIIKEGDKFVFKRKYLRNAGPFTHTTDILYTLKPRIEFDVTGDY